MFKRLTLLVLSFCFLQAAARAASADPKLLQQVDEALKQYDSAVEQLHEDVAAFLKTDGDAPGPVQSHLAEVAALGSSAGTLAKTPAETTSKLEEKKKVADTLIAVLNQDDSQSVETVVIEGLSNLLNKVIALKKSVETAGAASKKANKTRGNLIGQADTVTADAKKLIERLQFAARKLEFLKSAVESTAEPADEALAEIAGGSPADLIAAALYQTRIELKIKENERLQQAVSDAIESLAKSKTSLARLEAVLSQVLVDAPVAAEQAQYLVDHVIANGLKPHFDHPRRSAAVVRILMEARAVAFAEIVAAAKSQNGEVRRAAGAALRDLGEEKTEHDLLTKLQEILTRNSDYPDDPILRRFALEALLKMQEPEGE